VKTEYVTVPVAWKLPVRVAESETVFPIVIDVDDSRVSSVGLVLLTVNGSQGLVKGALLVSPL
jgi:hypothetical protein